MRSRTRVVFVQHPRESRVAISTCRMAHLSLPNSELYVALTAEESPRLMERVTEPGAMLLFPAPDAVDVETLAGPLGTLIVVDGTWNNARKLFQRSPALRALPRLFFRPQKPSNYRIRREPNDQSLSTIEATAHVLERLEKAPGRFTPMLGAFDVMVERQIAFAERGTGWSRYGSPRRPKVPRRSPAAGLIEAFEKLVLFFGEANAWPRGVQPTGFAELLQLVAVRPFTGERFEAVLRPARPLSPMAPAHLGVDRTLLDAGEDRRAAVARFLAFLPEGAVLAAWGPYPFNLLRGECIALDRTIDARAVVRQMIGRRPGGVEAVAGVPPSGVLRAWRRIEALDRVVGALVRGELAFPTAEPVEPKPERQAS